MFGECHAHALMNGVNYREAVALHREKANEEAVRQCLRAYQEAEVSFVRDGGDPYGVAFCPHSPLWSSSDRWMAIGEYRMF